MVDYGSLPRPTPADLPSLSQIPKDAIGFPAVYEPAEDTYLLVDTLHAEENYLKSRFKNVGALALEIGCGTGAALCALSKILGAKAAYFATDVNPIAAATCAKNLELNGARVFDVVGTDLVQANTQKVATQMHLQRKDYHTFC